MSRRLLLSIGLFVVVLLGCCFFLKEQLHQLDRTECFLTFLNKGNRQGHLYDAVIAYKEQKIPLIRYVDFIDQDSTEKKVIFPMETAGDDLGMYYVIPMMSSFFNVDFQTLYFVFFIGLIVVGFILASWGFHLLFPSTVSFVISTLIYAVLAVYSLYILDVYSIVFLCVSIVPLAIYLSQSKNMYAVLFFLMFSGLILGSANIFRNHSGTGIFIFMTIGIIMLDVKPFKKTAFVAILGTFFTMPYIYINREMSARNQALLEKGFDQRMFEGFNTSHIFWHSVYLGLGYDKQNPYQIQWADDFGYNTARQMIKDQGIKGVPRINPLSMPSKYEELIQEKFWDIFLHDPVFVFKTWGLKLWQVLKIWVWFINIGLILLFFQTWSKQSFLPFIAAILFYLLPGILVYPHHMYILGGLILTGLVLIFLIDQTLNRLNLA